MGRELSKWVENTLGKGEIAHYEQFLLFPQCFQKACFTGASKGVIVWEWVNGDSSQIHVSWTERQVGKATTTIFKDLGLSLGHCGSQKNNSSTSGSL